MLLPVLGSTLIPAVKMLPHHGGHTWENILGMVTTDKNMRSSLCQDSGKFAIAT